MLIIRPKRDGKGIFLTLKGTVKDLCPLYSNLSRMTERLMRMNVTKTVKLVMFAANSILPKSAAKMLKMHKTAMETHGVLVLL